MAEIRVPWNAGNIQALNVVLPAAESGVKDTVHRVLGCVYVTSDEFIATDRYCALSYAHTPAGSEPKKWSEIDHTLDGMIFPLDVAKELVAIKPDVYKPKTVVFDEEGVRLLDEVGETELAWGQFPPVGNWPPVGKLFNDFEAGETGVIGFGSQKLAILQKAMSRVKAKNSVAKFAFSGKRSSGGTIQGATLVTINTTPGFSALVQPSLLSS